MNKYAFQSILGGIGFSAASLIAVQQVVAQNANFSDVRGYWGEPYVTTLADRKIIGGFPDGTFQPNALITRAQFAAIAAKALGLNTSSGGRTFVDVPVGYWAAPAITAVSNSGLVTGFPDGTFRPDDKITRAQALVILAKALRSGNSDATGLNRYSDAQAIPQWATESVAKAANAGIIVNFPNPALIDPNNLATRGEVAALMYQTLSRLGRDLPPITIGLLDGSYNSGNNPPPATSLTLERVGLNNDQRPYLVGGDELIIRAVGTPKANATFTIDGVTQNIPMTETQAGTYVGRYTVRRGDSQANARITVSLSLANQTPVTKEASRTMTIDAAPPEVRDLQPANQTRTPNRQTDISAVFSDGQGIGVEPSSIRLYVNGVDVTSQSTVNSNFINYRPVQPLTNDVVNVEVRLADRAGNQASRSWLFGFGAGNTNNPNNPQSFLVPQITNFANNAAISLPIRLVGRTAPSARVQVQANALSTIGGVVGFSQPLLNTTVQADGFGNFAFDLNPTGFSLPSGTRYQIVLRATDAQTGTSQTSEVFFVQR